MEEIPDETWTHLSFSQKARQMYTQFLHRSRESFSGECTLGPVANGELQEQHSGGWLPSIQGRSKLHQSLSQLTYVADLGVL